MSYWENTALCVEIGIRDGQEKRSFGYQDLQWSLDRGRTFFGRGDLDDKDLKKIYEWLSKPENQTKVFTGWDSKYGTSEQETNMPEVRISFGAGVTRPHYAHLSRRFG